MITNERTLAKKLRIKIILFLQIRSTPPTYKEIQEYIGAKSIYSAQHHIATLIEEGLVSKGGSESSHRSIILSPIGRTVAEYLEANSTEETLLERITKNEDGVVTRIKVRQIRQEAQTLDEKRINSNRNGLNRRKIGETKKRIPVREPECKVSNQDIVAALRTCTTYTGAAETLKISRRSLMERIDRLSGETE